MNLELEDVDFVGIEPNNSGSTRTLKLDIRGVSESNVLDQIPIKNIISHFGAETFLDEIGKEEAIVHFDLGPEEEG